MSGLFSQLNQDIKIQRCTTPQRVSSTVNPDDEPYEQKIKRYERVANLSLNIKKKLSSPETSQKIQVIGQKYGFELLRLANITRLIREYYFGEVRFSDFPAEIERRVGVSLLTAQEITRYIKQEIIDWDPWAQYLAKLPKMSVREMFEKKLKIVDTEITSGYVELRGGEDLEDPTIKNWIQDYITHLGYAKHSQMQRTEYLFHSENGKNLSSQDREKLGIILRSFDENIPLPVDEENGEIVFDELIEKSPPPAPGRTVPTLNFAKPSVASQPSFVPPSRTTTSQSEEFVHPNLVSQPSRKISHELNKFFNTPETSEIPSIKIHSITECAQPQTTPPVQPPQPVSPPQPNIQRPVPPQPQPAPHPKHIIIDPFPERFSEPKIDGNVVDLSGK